MVNLNLHDYRPKLRYSDDIFDVSYLQTPAIKLRNKSWANNKHIPDWVDVKTVDLDQFFTRPDIAEYCYQSLCSYVTAHKMRLSDYTFVEPSAGLGAFYNLLPENRRIGVDVVRFNAEYTQKDFLSWQPKDKEAKYISVGNPPFGYRAWLALAFLNHTALFSDYVGFIMPMAFQSNGKSNPKDRVNGLHLVHSE